jgi:hypothetical protein
MRNTPDLRLWNLRFQQLAEYKRAHGHCTVPRKDPTLQLGRWVGIQRVAKWKNKLSDSREATLNTIGFDWRNKMIVLDWDDRFEHLVEYKKMNGDCNVSRHDSAEINLQLFSWARRQRETKFKNKLSAEREAKLNSIGFVWSINCSHAADWKMHFRQLMEYKEAIGDCNVPQEFSPNPQLGLWVQKQRRKHKYQKLTKEHWEQLNSIRFDWGE